MMTTTTATPTIESFEILAPFSGEKFLAEEQAALQNPIPDKLYFRIGDVSHLLGVKPYVLRYWESEFSVISPQKSTTGQRVYRRNDVEILVLIKHLLYNEKYSIEGARRRIRELRKDGELKNSKKQVSLVGRSDPEMMKNLKAVAIELRELIQIPISQIFRY